MKRSVEFRVWDLLERRFTYSSCRGQEHYILSLDGKFLNLQNGVGGSECVVQQYTGVKDENSSKIYQGDIVQVGRGPSDRPLGIAEVVWEEDMEIVRTPQWGLRFLRPAIGFVGDMRGPLKILGNTFETSLRGIPALSESLQ